MLAELGAVLSLVGASALFFPADTLRDFALPRTQAYLHFSGLYEVDSGSLDWTSKGGRLTLETGFSFRPRSRFSGIFGFGISVLARQIENTYNPGVFFDGAAVVMGAREEASYFTVPLVFDGGVRFQHMQLFFADLTASGSLSGWVYGSGKKHTDSGEVQNITIEANSLLIDFHANAKVGMSLGNGAFGAVVGMSRARHLLLVGGRSEQIEPALFHTGLFFTLMGSLPDKRTRVLDPDELSLRRRKLKQAQEAREREQLKQDLLDEGKGIDFGD